MDRQNNLLSAGTWKLTAKITFDPFIQWYWHKPHESNRYYNISVIYGAEIGDNYIVSFIPGRAMNGLRNIFKGKNYIVILKGYLDLSDYFYVTEHFEIDQLLLKQDKNIL